MLVGGAISIGCRNDAQSDTATQTETDTDAPMMGPLCPSLGLDEAAALLVTQSDARVVIVRADGSTLELDAYPPEAPYGDRFADFAVSAAGIVTTTRWYLEDDRRYSGASMFELDGRRRWAMQWEGGAFDLIGAAKLSATGDVAIALDGGLVTVRGDEIQTYPGLAPLAAPNAGQVAAVTTDDPEANAYGWLDLDARTFTAVPILGDVVAHEGRLVSLYAGASLRVQISAPHEDLREIRIESDLPFDNSRLAGSRMLLTQSDSYGHAAHVDLDAGTVTIEELEPPDGFATFACGWPALTETGDVLFPLTDGSAVWLYELTPAGEWNATPAMPLTGVPGGFAQRVGGTYSFRSLTNANSCDDVLPEREGTLVGDSLQLVRPESGVSFAWGDLAEYTYATSTSDGRCAAWRPAPDRLTVVDMVTGDEREIDVPADAYAFVD